MYYDNNLNLQKLIQINKNLDSIYTFNNNTNKDTQSFPREHYNYSKYNINNNLLNEENYKMFGEKLTENNSTNSNPNSALNKICRINNVIDSVYDDMQLMKSNNKINCRILYQVNRSSQTEFNHF